MLTWRSGVRLVGGERARGALRAAGGGPDRDRREQVQGKAFPARRYSSLRRQRACRWRSPSSSSTITCLHQRVVLVTVLIEESPRIADEDRAEVIEIIPGITRGDPALRLHAIPNDL